MTMTDERKLDPTVTETALFRLYRRTNLEHDRSSNRECSKDYCKHPRLIALMEYGPDQDPERQSRGYRDNEKHLRGAFEKGRAAYRAGACQGDCPYGNVATHHRGSHRSRGTYKVSGWSRLYEWHWRFGWAWAEWMESDEGLLRVLAGDAVPDQKLWENYLNWLYDVRRPTNG